MKTNSVVMIKEYQSFCCVKGMQGYGYLDSRNFAKLESFILKNSRSDDNNVLELMKITYRSQVGKVITACNFVGTINFGSQTSLEILPKIYSPNSDTLSDEKVKEIFFKMLLSVKNMPFKKISESNINVQKKNIWEIFIKIFIDMLTVLVKQGLKSGYLTCCDNEAYFKGKLQIREHLRENFTDEKHFIEYDVFALDRPENKIIKSTLLFLQKHHCCSQNLKSIIQLLKFFSDVSPSKNYEDDFLKCRFERGMTGYADVLNICRAFLDGNSFNVFAGDNNLCALLFPMELLFESYIAKLLKKSFERTDYEVSIQEQKIYLFDIPQKFRLRPDIVIKHDNKTIVLDTKWKLLMLGNGGKIGILQQDMYQMYAYAKRYTAKQIILLYPYNDKCDKQSLEYYADDKSVCIKVMFVDLTKEDDIVDEVVSHIKNILM
ncbi:McrC family protein [uncultured Phascolarctobacterium sp.]|uniref:McrC family protein n=1 Tax=uncultured Phascolarctobacterium sp. TaxID=512296 RepID=UPI0025CF94D5|nr:McrC family protein [uncultured Phascolarctobacterium sp.]